MPQYIYLLQEREFIKTHEPIYKVGMTKQDNHARFKQYPKGSVLLFQMICTDCSNTEKQILKSFRKQFSARKDIGAEYFEGKYNDMIDVIYSTIKSEKIGGDPILLAAVADPVEIVPLAAPSAAPPVFPSGEFIQLPEEARDDSKESDDGEKPNDVQQIRTYEEWIQRTNFIELVITKKNGAGFYRSDGKAWNELHDKSHPDFDELSMESLSGWVESITQKTDAIIGPDGFIILRGSHGDYVSKKTGWVISRNDFDLLDDIEKEYYSQMSGKNGYQYCNVGYDVASILQDTINKCYNKNHAFYDLAYHEYLVISPPFGDNSARHEYGILNCATFKFTSLKGLNGTKIPIHNNGGGKAMPIWRDIDTDLVDQLLGALIIDPNAKSLFKTLAHALFVSPVDQPIVFCDGGGCLLSGWISDLLYRIARSDTYALASAYYSDETKFKKLPDMKSVRCVIIDERCAWIKVSVEKQIKVFLDAGIKLIIVRKKYRGILTYGVNNFQKYLIRKKKILTKCVEDATGHVLSSSDWSHMYEHSDVIFGETRFMMTHFLKWCCTK